MSEKLFTPKQLSELLRVTPQTLLQWENDGKIQARKTNGGHRRYIFENVETFVPSHSQRKAYIYARVSSSKQQEDLQRQIALLKETYPHHEVIQDIGSGINFRRRGLITLLERVFTGSVSEVVVAHKDRLTRFGFELFEFIFKRFQVSIRVLSDDDIKEPFGELAKDLFSILTVFSARYYDARSYSLQKNTVLPQQKSNRIVQQMPRRIKVLLQPSCKQNRRYRSARHRYSESEESETTRDGERS